MNEKAEKQAKEKLDKWLKEMGLSEDKAEKKCNEDFCELIKEEEHD